MKTPDLDPEEVRRALESPEWKQRPLVRPVEVIGDAAHEWLRLREQPAPDVQAQIDAAVAREREEIETRLCEVASLYPQRSGRRYALLQQVEWIRSRARSGV